MRRLQIPMSSMHRLLLGRRVADGFRAGAGSCVVARDVSIGRDVHLGRNVDIAAEVVEIGEGCEIDDNVTVRCRRLVMRPGSRISTRTTVYGYTTPESGLVLDEEAWVFADAHLNPDDLIRVGARTAVGNHAMIFTHSSYLPQTHGYPVKIAPVTIGADAWLAFHPLVLPGVTIGAGATIGACAVVGIDVPDNALAAGVPARVVKDAAQYRRAYSEADLIRLGRGICASVVRFSTESFRPHAIFWPQERDVSSPEPGVYRIARGSEVCELVYEPDASPSTALRIANDGTPSLFVEVRDVPFRPSSNVLHLARVRARMQGRSSSLVSDLVGLFSNFGIRFPRRELQTP